MKAVKIGAAIIFAAAVFAVPAFADDGAEAAEKTVKAEKQKPKGKNPFADSLKKIEKLDKDIAAAQEAEDTKKLETLTKQKGKEQEKLKASLEKKTAGIDKKIESLEKKLDKAKDANKKSSIQDEIDKLEKKRNDLECLSRGEDPSEE